MSAGELTVTAPYDGSRIAAVPRSDAAAIEKALSTAHGLYRDRDSWIAKVERIAILRRAMT
ncbi:MAG TPA: aldehyde dehydrogenase, partial [Alphaproteobacteria bacterium]|nr:aldehyde dehydrogenase [Alphaproteobacteria bacterium]